MQEVQANTAIKVKVGPFVDVGDGFTPETGITLGAADEAELFKHDAAAVTDISGNTWAAIGSCDGWYNLTLSTTDTNTEGLLDVIVQDDSVCLPVHCRFMVLAQAAWISKYTAKDTGYMDVDAKAISASTAAADNVEANIGNLDAATSAVIADTEDLQTQVGTAGAGLTDLGGMSTGMKAEVESEVDDAVGGGTGTALTAIPWNSNWDAEVQSECADALTAYDPPTKAEMDTGHGLLATEAKQDIIDTVVDGIQTDLSNVTDGLGALKALIDAVQSTANTIEGYADLIDDATNGLAAIKAEVEGIGGVAMRGTDNAATEAKQDIIDTVVDGIQTDLSNATDGLGALKTEIDANETKIDTVDTVVDGIQTDLSNATDGLGALKALIDTVDGVVDAILTDTGTTLDTKINDIQGTGFSAATDSLVHIHDDHVKNITAAYGSAQKTLIDGLPSGIAKGIELADFTFPMILSSDHETYATGKTLTEEISKDGGNYAACTNSASEIQSSGTYKITLTATEMNANIVTLRFTETDCDTTGITIITT